MRKYLLFIFVFSISFVNAQKRKKIHFDVSVIDKKDTVKTGFTFFIVAKQDTIFPKIEKDIYTLKVRDSFVDFYLQYQERQFIFSGIWTFYMSDAYWDILVNDKASDTNYQVIAREAGSVKNVHLAGNNSFTVINDENGNVQFIREPTNTIYLKRLVKKKSKLVKKIRVFSKKWWHEKYVILRYGRYKDNR